MGRHSAPTTHWLIVGGRTPTPGGAARYVGRVGALAVALGVGAAVAGGSAIAAAEDGATHDSKSDKSGSQSTSNTTPARDTVGRDSPVDEPTGGLPGGLKAALRVPRAVLGLNGGAPTNTVGTRAKTPSNTSDAKTKPDADDPAKAVVDSILTVPQHLADLVVGSAPPDSTPVSQPKGPTRTPPQHGTAVDPTGSGTPSTTPFSSTPLSTTPPDDPTAPVQRVQSLANRVDPTPASLPDQLLNRSSVQRVAPTTSLVPQLSAPTNKAPITTVITQLLAAVGLGPSAGSNHAPLGPIQSLVGVLGLISRDIEEALNNAVHQTNPTTTSQTNAEPAPGDTVQTPYGEVGKWMLESNDPAKSDDSTVANWGGQLYGDKTLREPVNVIIIDPDTSQTPEQSKAKVDSAMTWSGFPAQPIHSTGFAGEILGTEYAQMPADGSEAAYSDLPFFLPNDHARVFGPAKTDDGYVYTAGASTEVPGIYDNQLTHRYVSFDLARDALALRMILSGRATFVGVVPMENAYNEGNVSTGDHDGYAVVLRLT